jgi:hypothetical protein
MRQSKGFIWKDAMEARIGLISKSFSRISYVLGSICLLAGLILSYANIPASAAELNAQESSEENACTPPQYWDETERYTLNNPTEEWTFEVNEPQMDVELEFFWYQDYDKQGCPYDCVNTDDCQDYETGDVTSPLGDFSIADGKEGVNDGGKTLSGVLSQGTYTVTFTFTGRKGSINVGLWVRMDSIEVETPTPTPTDVPPETETPTPTTSPTDTPTPTAILTDTPTPTGTISAGTPSPTSVSPGSTDTPTPTATEASPSQTPTATNTSIVNPPVASPTPTDVEKKPPATLSPPTPPPGATKTPAIIPVTGLDLVYKNQQPFLTQNQFLNLGIGFLGLGLVFHGISRKLNNR